MTLADWLAAALRDAEQRGLRELRPILEGLASTAAVLRAAPWTDDAAERAGGPAPSDAR